MQIDLTPPSLDITVMVGDSWKQSFYLKDADDTPIILTGVSLFADILKNNVVISQLNLTNGITVAEDGYTFTVRKDWRTKQTQNGIPVLVPAVTDLELGTYKLIVRYEKTGEDVALFVLNYKVVNTEISTEQKEINQAIISIEFVNGKVISYDSSYVGTALIESAVNTATQKAQEAAASALEAANIVASVDLNDRPFVKASQVILKGQAVYVSDANGTNKIVSLASNDTEVKSSNVYGIAMQNFAINDTLQVVRRGVCPNLNTSSATIGDSVWLGVNGNLLYGIANKPYGTHLVYLGIVTQVHATQGKIDVDIKNGFEVNELHDVLFGSLQDLELFGYVAGKWRNVSRYMKVEKYTAENQLPTTGSFSSVYFLNVGGSKYLKYWNGTAYVNASTKTDLPKCVSGIQRDYYATFADISTANYNGRNADICVIEDENNANGTGAYYFDGVTLNELLLL